MFDISAHPAEYQRLILTALENCAYMLPDKRTFLFPTQVPGHSRLWDAIYAQPILARELKLSRGYGGDLLIGGNPVVSTVQIMHPAGLSKFLFRWDPAWLEEPSSAKVSFLRRVETSKLFVDQYASLACSRPFDSADWRYYYIQNKDEIVARNRNHKTIYLSHDSATT